MRRAFDFVMCVFFALGFISCVAGLFTRGIDTHPHLFLLAGIYGLLSFACARALKEGGKVKPRK